MAEAPGRAALLIPLALLAVHPLPRRPAIASLRVFIRGIAAGNLAVVAVLFNEGTRNQALAEVLGTLPAPGATHALAGTFDPTPMLPEQHGYYAFQGSLTTPPCSENVHWQVLKEPIEVSREQVAAFRKLYPMNARPTQPLNGRKLLESRS